MNDPVSEQVARVVEVVRAVLADDAIGAYLYGSAVVGGLRPASDVDLFVVSRRPTTRDERQRLFDGLSPISGRRTRPAGWRPVELTVVVQSEVRHWRYPPRLDFQYGEWLRTELESGELDPPSSASPDLAVLIEMVRLADRPLLGPRPSDVLDPVPRSDLTAAMTAEIDGLLADLESDTRNVLLTLARIWSTTVTGAIHSKDAAADWALARLPEEHRPVLARARDAYIGEAEESWDGTIPQIRAHAAHAVDEIRRAAGEPL